MPPANDVGDMRLTRIYNNRHLVIKGYSILSFEFKLLRVPSSMIDQQRWALKAFRKRIQIRVRNRLTSSIGRRDAWLMREKYSGRLDLTPAAGGLTQIEPSRCNLALLDRLSSI